MQDHLSQHTYASRPCCACAWPALTCARTYFPFHRPRPAADDIISEVLPTKMPMSGSSGIVPQMSPNTPRTHPNPFSRTYSPHGMPSHMSHVSRAHVAFLFTLCAAAPGAGSSRELVHPPPLGQVALWPPRCASLTSGASTGRISLPPPPSPLPRPSLETPSVLAPHIEDFTSTCTPSVDVVMPEGPPLFFFIR